MSPLKQKGISFKVGIAPNQTMVSIYDAKNAIPKNVLIDKEGFISYISSGYREKNLTDISTMIEMLLGE